MKKLFSKSRPVHKDVKNKKPQKPAVGDIKNIHLRRRLLRKSSSSGH